jgi:hypothetical protein
VSFVSFVVKECQDATEDFREVRSVWHAAIWSSFVSFVSFVVKISDPKVGLLA